MRPVRLWEVCLFVASVSGWSEVVALIRSASSPGPFSPFSGRTAQVHNQKSSPFCPIEPRSPAAILPPSHLAMFSLVPGGNILAGLIPSLFLASIRWLIGFLDCNRCNFLINIGSQSVILWVFSLEHALFFFFLAKGWKNVKSLNSSFFLFIA